MIYILFINTKSSVIYNTCNPACPDTGPVYYYLGTDPNLCRMCINGCLTCNSDTVCLSCMAGTALNTHNNKCV